jgi:hypothetical protein
MQVLIVDCDYVNIHKKGGDKGGVSKDVPRIEGYTTGMICMLRDNEYKILNDKPKGKERLDYLCGIISENYKQSKDIWLYYNDSKNICIVPSSVIENKTFINICKNFDSKTLFWTCIDLKNIKQNLDSVLDSGFLHPYITNVNPANQAVPVSMAFVYEQEKKRKKGGYTITNKSSIKNKISHLIQDFKSGNECTANVRISKEALAHLKKTSDTHSGFSSQKEMTGELYIKDVEVLFTKGRAKPSSTEGENINKTSVYVIDLIKESIESGSEEEVDVAPTRYNFHSHPKEAYVRHSVSKAWPSQIDYNGYFKLGSNTIFHCVATLEGLYVMSFSSYWGKRLKEVPKSFISSNYKIPQNSKLTPEEYVKKINEIRYKGHPVFKVFYFTWDKAGEVFQVYYPQIKNSCLATQETVDIHGEIHK